MEVMSRRKFGQLMAAGVCALSGSVNGVASVGKEAEVFPDCVNPEHPLGLPTEMMFLGAVDHTKVFGCRSCWDVNRAQSVRVATDPEYRRWVRAKLAKQGRLLTKKPVVMFCTRKTRF